MTGSRVRSGWVALVVSAGARFLLATVALLLALSVVVQVAGWQSTVVMSGSMAPAVSAGDLVVVRPAGPAALVPGRIVLVDDPDVPGKLRLHRIAAVEDGMLRLKGDANPRPDTSLVAPRAVHGVGTLRLPWLGLPVVWAAQGRIAPLVGTGLALAALVALALLHRAPPGREQPRPRPAPPAVWRRWPGGPGRTRRRRVLAAVAVLLLLAALPAAAGARAVFDAVAPTPASSWAASTYWTCGAGITAAGATQYYPLQESGGTTAANQGTAGIAANATYSSSGISYRVPGPRCAIGQQSAVSLNGSTGAIAANNAVTDPETFTVQIWFATTTTSGGKIIGFGSSQTGASASYDRHVYMLNSGQLAFGLYDGSYHVITSPGAYNDGQWHLMTATYSAAPGMRLYVDGVNVARDISTMSAGAYTGYWRVGYDNLSGWPNAPTSNYFNGSVAHAAVFTGVVAATEVANQYGAGPWSCADAAGPSGSAAPLYLPLQETSGTTAVNSGSSGTAGNGTYSSPGVTSVSTGPNCGTGAAAAAKFNGSTSQVWTTQAVSNPQSFTVQVWFSTTATTGGRLIGFGTASGAAASGTADRHIYMSNNGTLTFGVYNGGYGTVTSSAAYNDGGWHLATGAFSPGTGLSLYVDGSLVGTNPQATAAANVTGYWRLGYDTLAGWPGAPSDPWFTGKLADASVYYRVLAADEITGQYTAGR